MFSLLDGKEAQINVDDNYDAKNQGWGRPEVLESKEGVTGGNHGR